MNGGETKTTITPPVAPITLHKRRHITKKKVDDDMLDWALVEASGNWQTILQQPQAHKKTIQVSEITSSCIKEDSGKEDGDKVEPINLMTPLIIPNNTPSSKILEFACSNQSIYSSKAHKTRPPSPPPVPKPSTSKTMEKKVPAFIVRSVDEAHSDKFQSACYSVPVALIQGLPKALDMDLNLYSVKTLYKTNPDQEVEVRTQRRMDPEINIDPQTGERTWFCTSNRSHSTIKEYAEYMAASYLRESRKDNDAANNETVFKKPRISSCSSEDSSTTANNSSDHDNNNSDQSNSKLIKFGTNVDLSDPAKWKPQLDEIKKLPGFLSLRSPSNILSHLGHIVLGMNTVQLYMKVPGCRTPGHQENLSFAGTNVNVGPGDVVWVAVENDYWGKLHKMCKKRGLDYLKGSWWPNIDDLEDNNIPYYIFTQKPGDIVWIGPGTVHWVQATGHCVNIAWNNGIITGRQMELALERYEWNKLRKFERSFGSLSFLGYNLLRYKSIVPMLHLSWRLAKHIVNTSSSTIAEASLFESLKGVLGKSLFFIQETINMIRLKGKDIQDYEWREGEDLSQYCKRCAEEVFNLLFVNMDQNGENWVYCVHCALKFGFFDPYFHFVHGMDDNLKDFSILRQFSMRRLTSIYDALINHKVNFEVDEDANLFSSTPPTNMDEEEKIMESSATTQSTETKVFI